MFKNVWGLFTISVNATGVYLQIEEGRLWSRLLVSSAEVKDVSRVTSATPCDFRHGAIIMKTNVPLLQNEMT
jgi:hypothetical protein